MLISRPFFKKYIGLYRVIQSVLHIWFCYLTSSNASLHTTKKILPSPTLQIGSIFYIDVDQGSLINKKKNWRIALACLFFVVDVLIWCLSQHISVKKAFLSRTERFGSFLFCFFYSNLGLPSAKSLQNGRFSFLLSLRKIEPVTTHKMASHLIDVNIIF